MTEREIQIVTEFAPRIVNGLVREREFRTLHSLLWEWRARNPDKGSFEWPGWLLIPGNLLNHCFACEWTRRKCIKNCNYCPIMEACGQLVGEFEDARDYNHELAPLIARQIADSWEIPAK